MNFDDEILRKYLEGKCTPDEKALVEVWFEQFNANPSHEVTDHELQSHIASLDRRVKGRRSVVLHPWKLLAGIAASTIIFLAIAIHQFYFAIPQLPELVLEDIKAPTSSNTVLVLEDNRTYDLDSLSIGDTLRAKGYLITKLKSGELHYIYEQSSTSKAYNTVRTGVGGIAHLKLSDGTLVWLNANSEVTYPIDFSAGRRDVSLKGEGYFEVTSAAQYHNQPFYVRGERQTIKVMGTKFNANFTERRQTALLEGHVAVSNEGSSLGTSIENEYAVSILPGQVYDGSKIVQTSSVDRYIDWKEGYFDLNELSLIDLAEKLSSWYGVEVKVQAGLENVQLFGRVSRQKDLKEVLDLVSEASDVKYQLQTNTIHIVKTIKN